jgi:hypothetical protein
MKKIRMDKAAFIASLLAGKAASGVSPSSHCCGGTHCCSGF